MENFIIWKDKNNLIVWESGEVNSYCKAIFGGGWMFCKHLLFSVSLERAREIKKEITEQNKKHGI